MKTIIKKYKKDESYSYTLGIYPTIKALRNKNIPLTNVILDDRAQKSDAFKEIENLCASRNIDIVFNGKTVEMLGKGDTFAVGVFEKYSSEISAGSNHIILDRISDFGNLGTIIRTMLSFEFTQLALIRPCVDIFNPSVIRASMGSMLDVKFEYFDSIEMYRRLFKNEIIAFMLDGDLDMKEIKPIKSFSLAFGNEGVGLAHEYKEFSKCVKIDQSNKTDSLNLSIAAGIGMHYFRGFNP